MPDHDLYGGLLNLRKATNILAQLQKLGVEEIVYSPGSRNTPLSIAAHQNDQLTKTVIIDERSAGFFALGRAKSTGKPVALSCTSGSAVANYYPAAVEAYYMHVPLFFLTADRPGYLIGTGAPQTMQQHAFFGEFAPTFEAGEQETHLSEQQWLSLISKIEKKLPVQINIPFEKPLQPDFSEIESVSPQIYPDLHISELKSIQPLPLPVLQIIRKSDRPVAIFGPSSVFPNPHQSALDFCKKLRIPYIKESLSNLKKDDAKAELTHWQGLVRHWAQLEEEDPQLPDLILRFDRQPVAKGFELFFEHHHSIPHLHIYHQELERHDATFSTDLHLKGYFDWQATSKKISRVSKSWISGISELNKRVYYNSKYLTDGKAIATISKSITKNTAVHLANSFPVRDFDMFAESEQPERTYCNRGLNGIDGTIATAIGESGSHQHTILCIGDVTFAHDAGSLQLNLLAKNLTIFVINNGGGTIFDMLPIRSYSEDFRDHYFKTKPTISVIDVAQGYGIPATKITSAEDLNAFIKNQGSTQTMQIVEVVTDPEESNKERLSRWKW